MSTVESGRRVALLARPGAARDCVRGALLEVGAQVVAEEDPVSADPEAVRSASPQVLMIVLDTASEDALGRFDAVIGDPGIEVMFEEAEVAVAREGWEAARWRRHLAAKLHHRDDVLPPSAAAASVPAVDALSLQIEELIAVQDDGESTLALDLPAEAVGGSDFSVFDPVAAEGGSTDERFDLSVEGLSFDAAAFAADDHVLPPVTGPDFTASDFDPLLAELDADGSASTDAVPDGFEAIYDAQAREATDNVPPTPGAAGARYPGFGELSLADDAPAAAAPSARAPVRHDLDELERRIAGLQLVEDGEAAAGSSPAPAPTSPPPIPPPLPGVRATGAVLVLAGLGGPDAVRQFLGALPSGFPKPVLIRQRLDGARYDKLVAQMQRATGLPVMLAAAGTVLQAATVHIVPDDVMLDASDGLRFVAGTAGDIVDALPAPESAVVVLSGSEAADADRIAALAPAGLWMGAQATDGCYDPIAPIALAAHGAVTAPPAELARQLAERWSP